MAEAVRIIHRSTDCEAVMITDAKEVLAKVGGGGEFEALEHCPLIAPIPDSIRTGNALMEIYTAQGDQRELFCPALEGNVGSPRRSWSRTRWWAHWLPSP